MQLESTTRTIRSVRIGIGHVMRLGAWRDAPIMRAIQDLSCGWCQAPITASESFSRGGGGNSQGASCSKCRPHHLDRKGDEDCWLCQRPEDAPQWWRPEPKPLVTEEPRILEDDTDLQSIAQFFRVTKGEVFNALAPLIFDGKVDRRLIWKLVLQACEARHGGLSSIEQRIDEVQRRRANRRSVSGLTSAAVRLRDQGYCRYCAVRLTRSTKTLDHVIPFSLGGLNTADNIVQCCRPCNAKKRDDSPRDAKMYLLPPGTTRSTIPLLKDRRPLVDTPLDNDWPELVTGTATYQLLSERYAARRARFGSLPEEFSGE
jgi:5-methylcytosine-specific restriction endonuclease McrA